MVCGTTFWSVTVVALLFLCMRMGKRTSFRQSGRPPNGKGLASSTPSPSSPAEETSCNSLPTVVNGANEEACKLSKCCAFPTAVTNSQHNPTQGNQCMRNHTGIGSENGLVSPPGGGCYIDDVRFELDSRPTIGAKLLRLAWEASGRDAGLSPPSEAMLQDAESYLASVVEVANDPKCRGLTWSQKYPLLPPLSTTSHAEAQNTFIRWLGSWTDGSVTSSSVDAKPTDSGSGNVMDDDGDVAERVSRRRQKRERESQEAREVALRQSKGYFKTADHHDGFYAAATPRTSTVSNIAVLSGPTGLGKTALVEAVAKRCNFYLLDIHTGVQRSPANLEVLFREATQAGKLGARRENGGASLEKLQQSLVKMEHEKSANKKKAAKSASISAFFEPRKAGKKTLDTVTIVHATAPVPASSSSENMSPLVLLDSGDVVFPDESGFHTALCRITESSKCPVIVTSNTEYTDKALLDTFGSGVPQLIMRHPDEYVVLFYILCILRCERPDEEVCVADVLRFIRGYKNKTDIRGLVNALSWVFVSYRCPRFSDQVASPSPLSERQRTSLEDVSAACLDALDELTSRLQCFVYFKQDNELIHYDPDGITPDESGLESFFQDQWKANRTHEFGASWHCDVEPLEEVLALHERTQLRFLSTMLQNRPRQQFFEGGWSVSLGDFPERDNLREQCFRGRSNSNKRLFLYAAESSSTLLDFVTTTLHRTPI